MNESESRGGDPTGAAAAPRRLLVMAVACVLAACALAACAQARRAEAPPPPVDPTRLSHAQHAQLPCGGCHRGDARPGADDHKPCDDGACHSKEFLGPPGRFCEVCHAAITAPAAGRAAQAVPESTTRWQALPPRFSHRRHLDARLMEQRVGFHVACADCHTRDGKAASRPDHAACARCHAAEVGARRGRRGWRTAPAATSRARGCATRARLIRDDLHFDHDAPPRRSQERSRSAARRATCAAAQSTAATAITRRRGSRAASAATTTPSARRREMRMRICETCHTRARRAR